MKSRTLLAYAAVCAIALSHLNHPLNAAVESDIVGYTTMTMEAGKWYQVGVPFAPLNNEAVPTLVSSFPNGFTDGDMVYIYDSASGAYPAPLTYCAGRNTDTELTWRNTRLVAKDPELPIGTAVFFKKAQTSDVLVSGVVDAKLTTVFGNESQSSWAQIVCPYPDAIAINDMNWQGIESGDKLYIYSVETGSYPAPLTYCAGRDTDTELKWRNARLVASTLIIEPGQSLFVNKVSIGKATLSAE